ncbi:hypothetical protein HHK36_019910 [Tetracentron sinense]|uniref:Cysteine protease n=1 Tax=Tetracentron sinense TaxID=13715 RepID=A0A834YXX2_TETSI|nr:hypothetical protein HHK36_019910 [Tetracentron sinense]
MKGMPEKTLASKYPAGSSIGSPNIDPTSFNSGQKISESKSSKGSVWSSFFSSAFSFFETYSESHFCEKKAFQTRTYGWSTAMSRVVTGGSMRRLQECILGPSTTGGFSSTSEIWLLGVCYKVSQEESSDNAVISNGLDAFVEDFSSRIWMTYRKGFDVISDSKFTSDVNWGCMLRSSQMLVAQAMLFHHLGRSWRKPIQRPFDQEYIEILHLFGDSEDSAFSIHNLLRAGKAYGLDVGSWVGPYAMCRSWETLVRSKRNLTDIEMDCQLLAMAIYIVSGDEDGERGGAPVLCVEDATKLCFEFSKDQVDQTPILLLVPLVLGLDKVNPRYIPSLWKTFTFPQSLGILGGKPGVSTYIVGVQDDKAFYLDPHEVQLEWKRLRERFAKESCVAVKDDFDDFCVRASKLADDSNGAPLFTVVQSHNLSKPVNHDDVLVNKLGDSGGIGEDDTFDMENSTQVESCSHEDDWQLL